MLDHVKGPPMKTALKGRFIVLNHVLKLVDDGPETYSGGSQCSQVLLNGNAFEMEPHIRKARNLILVCREISIIRCSKILMSWENQTAPTNDLVQIVCSRSGLLQHNCVCDMLGACRLHHSKKNRGSQG